MSRADVLALRWPRLPMGPMALAGLLFAAFLLMRMVATLGPVSLRAMFFLMCLGMIALPWILLTREGRNQIGLRRASSFGWYPLAIAVGAGIAVLCHLLGMLMFGNSADHWFVSVSQNYLAHPVSGMGLLQLHLMFTIVAMLFSPIGEELFFRGYLQQVLEPRYGTQGSAWLQSTLFGLVHLLHHGIVIGATGLMLLPLSGAIWLVLMIGFSLACSWLRHASGSLFPAILAHAAFNAAMNSLIFAYLWPR